MSREMVSNDCYFFSFFEENEIDFSFDDKREMLYNYRLIRFSRQIRVLRVLSFFLSNERTAVHFSRVTIYRSREVTKAEASKGHELLKTLDDKET